MRRECLEEASVEVSLGRILGAFGGPQYRARFRNGGDETQDVGWFAVDELETLELRRSSRLALASLGLAR